METKTPEKLEKVLVSRENGGAKIERCAKKMQSRLYRKGVWSLKSYLEPQKSDLLKVLVVMKSHHENIKLRPWSRKWADLEKYHQDIDKSVTNIKEKSLRSINVVLY